MSKNGKNAASKAGKSPAPSRASGMNAEAVLVLGLALAAPFIYGKLDPSMSDQWDIETRYSQFLTLLAAAAVVFVIVRVCTRTWCRLIFSLLLVVLIAAAPFALQQPGVSEKVIRTIVEKAGLPPSIFDHLKVKDDSVWYDIVTKGNLGIAEAYMHGKADVEPFQLFVKLLNGTSIGTRRKQSQDALSVFGDLVAAPLGAVAQIMNQQTKDKSTRVTEQHYDAGNDLYEKMLGPSMSYTCAYWKNAKNLDEAQFAKFDLILRKLQIPEGSTMKIADLGMGWGTLANYVHKNAPGKVSVNGVSLSKEQVRWASENLAKDGLKFIHQDYRTHCEDPSIQGTYDRVYSVGMLEHVGFKNHAGFFRCVKKLLKPDGLAVVHTIGEPDFVPVSDAFLEKYIFPGAVIPTLSSLTAAFENLFILEDFQNFGHDYAPTLAAWNVNAENFFKENPKAYTPEFQRMWHYYLKLCEALFELRINQLWHFVLSPRPTYRLGIERQS
jgi:cyclopropane-fatty-acyl-phospholipid synthase